MSEETQSLRSRYSHAETLRASLETFANSNTTDFQDTVASAIDAYTECVEIASQIALFSPNESLEDISSKDLQYLLIHYHVAELLFRNNRGERKALLLRAREELELYLMILEQYGMLSKSDLRLMERYREDKDGFTTASSGDAAKRREVKIQRFREEKALKQQLEHIKHDSSSDNADEILRTINLTQIAYCTHQAFASLESVALEMKMLALAPPVQPNGTLPAPTDERARNRERDGYSERLDQSLSSLMANGKAGPILSKDGRPIRPFTLLDSRQRLQQGVFKPSHNLPTMTIDEYLEEEKKRGGVIEGGGEASMQKEYVDEDDLEKADEATMKARHWDDFKEENPRGSGNTMNMG